MTTSSTNSAFHKPEESSSSSPFTGLSLGSHSSHQEAPSYNSQSSFSIPTTTPQVGIVLLILLNLLRKCNNENHFIFQQYSLPIPSALPAALPTALPTAIPSAIPSALPSAVQPYQHYYAAAQPPAFPIGYQTPNPYGQTFIPPTFPSSQYWSPSAATQQQQVCIYNLYI